MESLLFYRIIHIHLKNIPTWVESVYVCFSQILLHAHIEKVVSLNPSQRPKIVTKQKTQNPCLEKKKMAGVGLLVSDLIISFMWVWSGALTKIFVNNILGLGSHEPSGEVIKCMLSILVLFFFAFLGKITKGGAYNPLTVLADAISGDFRHFIFNVGARIPAQVSSFWCFQWFYW